MPVARSRSKKLRQPKAKQAELQFPCGHGGAREGAGRPKLKGSGVAHRARARLARSCPVHVTMRLREGLPALRRVAVEEKLRAIFCAMKARGGFKIVHYSIQNNHLHLLVEATGTESLSRGMQGLTIRIAKMLNSLWSLRGSVFKGRYHAVILRTPRQVRNAIVYVLTNAWKHGARIRSKLDRFASGWCFDGFVQSVTLVGEAAEAEPPVQRAGTWLLSKGWKRHGLICLSERARSPG